MPGREPKQGQRIRCNGGYWWIPYAPLGVKRNNDDDDDDNDDDDYNKINY